MSDEQPAYDEVGLAEAISAVEQAIEALSPFDISTSHIEQTLLQLRSYQDPWYEAKQAIKVHLDNGGHRVKAVAQYAQYLEKELANRKPLWIVVRADAIEKPLQVSENYGFLDCVFLDAASAERHKQAVEDLHTEAYYVRPLWGN